MESKLLQEALVRADQRRAAIESKRIEQSGGKYINITWSIFKIYISISGPLLKFLPLFPSKLEFTVLF